MSLNAESSWACRTNERHIEFRVAILRIADGHQRHLQAFLDECHLPVALAAQERATAEAVLASYRPSLDSLKWLLAPNGMGGAANETITCIDLGVIREEPESRLPSYCR